MNAVGGGINNGAGSGNRSEGHGRCTVCITDDHNIIRYAVKTYLEKTDEFSVIGEAGNVEDTLLLVQKSRPDILILDLGLPGKSGFEAILALKNMDIPTRILVFSMYQDEPKIVQAYRAGASGYISKNASAQEVMEAIRVVSKGERYIPGEFSHLREEIDEASSAGVKTMSEAFDALCALSRREREIFFMLVDGRPNRIIAKDLSISARTVETHRARIIRKLNAKSTAGLIQYAVRNSLVLL